MPRSGEPLSIRPGEAAGRFVLSGEIDSTNASDVAAIEPPPSGDLVLDVAGVTFIDSTGISALIGLAASATGRLVIVHPTPTVRMVLDIVDLAEIPSIAIED